MKYRASAALEQYILDNAPPHEAVLNAPHTFKQLNEVYVNLKYNDELPVYSGGCDDTIYSSPAVNHALRAMHDEVHFNEQLDFSLPSELEVARQQVMDAESLADENGLTCEDLNALWLDLAGQAMYYEVRGEFILEQDRFIGTCMRDGLKVVLATQERF